MEHIWARGEAVTSSGLMKEVGACRGWKPQTLLTLLSRLAERGFISAEKGEGREKRFKALLSRDEYLARETSAFLTEVHGRKLSSLLMSLNGERLSDSDINELERWFDRLKKGR